MKNIYSYLLLLFLLLACSNSFGQKAKDTPIAFEDDLELEWRDSEDTAYLVAKNKIYAPLEVILTIKKKRSESFLVPAKGETILISQPKVIVGKRSGTIQLDYQIGYHMGHPDVIDIDEDYLYALPFEKGQSYMIGQTWGGRATHYTPDSYYAVDFQLATGEPVHAAREGQVVKVIDWFTKEGGAELSAAANEVVVIHEDGTIASYVHLKYKGAVVEAGEMVERGQLLGYSGSTGYSTGPHLHFVVRRDDNKSIPIYFEGFEGKVLQKGEFYSH